MFQRLILVAVFLWSAPVALAVQPDEVLSDPALEARARTLSRDLRCLVCQNQSIDDFDAPLARDLRILVRERLVAGDSDAQVKDFLVARYGQFVLLKPGLNWHTAALWLAPPIILAAGPWCCCSAGGAPKEPGAKPAYQGGAGAPGTADERGRMSSARPAFPPYESLILPTRQRKAAAPIFSINRSWRAPPVRVEFTAFGWR